MISDRGLTGRHCRVRRRGDHRPLRAARASSQSRPRSATGSASADLVELGARVTVETPRAWVRAGTASTRPGRRRRAHRRVRPSSRPPPTSPASTTASTRLGRRQRRLARPDQANASDVDQRAPGSSALAGCRAELAEGLKPSQQSSGR